MKASYILRENLSALLYLRKVDAATLARAVGRDKSWINKILNGHRDMHVTDYDRVADFFGLATYQLFQPGIARTTERRHVPDRRKGPDRRISHAQRQLVAIQAELVRVKRKRSEASAR